MEVKVFVTEAVQYVVQAADKKGLDEAWINGGIGIAGALLGAVVGSLVSGLIARRAEQRRRDDELRAGVLSLVTKIDRIQDNMRYVHKWLLDGFKNQKKNNMPGLSGGVMPMYRPLNIVDFSIDEVRTASNFCGDKFMSRLRELDSAHNETVIQINQFNSQRFEANNIAEDLHVEPDISEKKIIAKRLAIRMKLLDTVLEGLADRAKTIFDWGSDSIGDLIIARGRRFKSASKVTILNLQGDPIVFEAWPNGLPQNIWSKIKKNIFGK